MVEGDLALLKRYKATTKQADPHPVLGASASGSKTKIVIREQMYYLAKDRKPESFRRNKKEVMNILARRKNAIISYAKKEQINVKKDEDLVKLFAKFNQLGDVKKRK